MPALPLLLVLLLLLRLTLALPPPCPPSPPPNVPPTLLNSRFLAPHSTPYILLPPSLVSSILPSPPAPRLPSLLSRAPRCDPLRPTAPCCLRWYLPSTLQHAQCLAAARLAPAAAAAPHPADPFNAPSDAHVAACLYRARPVLRACCLFLAARHPARAARCVATRENVLADGVNVCVMEEPRARHKCCVAMFAGRTFLYARCLRGVATFVNRQAPCVYRRVADQKKCCRQIFPAKGGPRDMRAYALCAYAVLRKTTSTNTCFEKDAREKEACCQHEKLYGQGPWNKCMLQEVPPCRIDSFEEREVCCHAEYAEGDFTGRSKCMIREFKRCQLYEWQDRMACCASMYKVGSTDMRDCLYQYIGTEVVFDEQERLSYCQRRNPPGSQNFKDCLRYSIKSCELLAKGNADAREQCCHHYFDRRGPGLDACLGRTAFADLLQSYYDDNRDWRPLSDATLSSEERVDYCTEVFDLEYRAWYRYACLAEITFSADERSLYHFTLFSDTAVLGHAQFSCAIYDEAEREACCSMTYAVASQAHESCLSWAPTLGFEHYDEVSSQEDMDLEAELSEVIQRPEAMRQQPAGAGDAASAARRRMGAFLKVMKAVEQELSVRPSARSLGGNAQPFRAYARFRDIVRRAVARNETGTFFHGQGKDWMTCALMRAADAREEDCVLYCGKLAVLDRGRVPARKPIRGWEGGALERVIRKRRSGMPTLDRFAAATLLQSPKPQGGGAVMVNLFGGLYICPLTNLAYTCNALCCDSYFAECWLCGWRNLECVG